MEFVNIFIQVLGKSELDHPTDVTTQKWTWSSISFDLSFVGFSASKMSRIIWFVTLRNACRKRFKR